MALPTAADKQASQQLLKAVTEATIDSGAIIVDPEKVVVKPPL